jgi:hypothetical protein
MGKWETVAVALVVAPFVVWLMGLAIDKYIDWDMRRMPSRFKDWEHR